MSVDLSYYARTESGNEYRMEGDLNITSNLSGMFYEALGFWLNDLSGKKGSEVAALVEIGISRMVADPNRFKPFEAKNGWGKYEDGLRFLNELLHQSKMYDDCELYVG